ncbi:MAG TPA: glycerol-3-phosphate acyltransferase [Chloroflexota bacterium]
MSLDLSHWIVAALAYLVGSIPFSYLVARSRGLDLRKMGSGVVSPANVRHVLGTKAAALALTGDVGKAILPVALARWLIDPGLAAYIALWVMVGHVWPIWLRFDGGRGMAIFVATGAILLPREIALLAIITIPIARLIHDTAPLAAVCVVLAPVLALAFGEPPQLAIVLGFMAILILLRRIVAPSQGPQGFRTLLSRLIFDRPDPRRHWTLDPEPSEETPKA